MKTPEEAEKSWAGASWREQNVFWPEVARRRAEAEAAKRRGGFTLIELMVVVVILGLTMFFLLPMAWQELRDHPVRGASQVLQAMIVQAQNSQAGEASGLRLVPEVLPDRLADGTIDPTKPLTSRHVIPISSPAPYSEGKVSVYPGEAYPAAITGGRSCLIVEECPGEWVATGTSYAWIMNQPTNWAHNLRVGERLTIGSNDPYAICGPMAIMPADGNPEQFVNYGRVGSRSGLSRTYTAPDGQSITATPEFLILANRRDDDRDGATDEGWDGIDNDARNGVDDAGEWEPEAWQDRHGKGVLNQPYLVHRRPVPTGAGQPFELSYEAVVDLSGWDGPAPRSRVVVNRYSGTVDILIDRFGRFRYDSPYGEHSQLRMDRGAAAQFLVCNRFDAGLYLKSDAKLLTLNRHGLTSVLDVNPDNLAKAYTDARRGSR